MPNGTRPSGRTRVKSAVQFLLPKKVFSKLKSAVIRVQSDYIHKAAIKRVKKLQAEGRRPRAELYPIAKPISFPSRLVPRNGKDYCSLYVRLVAQLMFQKVYYRTDAWKLAEKNKSAWKRKPTDHDPYSFLPHARPGDILGFYNPQSSRNGNGHAYTHVVLFVGTRQGKPLIMHRWKQVDRLETLDHLFHAMSNKTDLNPHGETGEVREIIRPRGEA